MTIKIVSLRRRYFWPEEVGTFFLIDQSIKNNHLELICELLNCEPNDLYEWNPSNKAESIESHPLKELQRTDSTQKFSEMMKTIPLERLDDVKNMLSELEDD